jgi:hypothetical protein
MSSRPSFGFGSAREGWSLRVNRAFTRAPSIEALRRPPKQDGSGIHIPEPSRAFSQHRVGELGTTRMMVARG